jgi:hypothetical protein
MKAVVHRALNLGEVYMAFGMPEDLDDLMIDSVICSSGAGRAKTTQTTAT